MSKPPPLPRRNLVQDRWQDTTVEDPVSQRITDPPPELPSRKETSALDLLPEVEGEGIAPKGDTKATSGPVDRRFVAPVPPRMPSQPTITRSLQTVLALFPSQRPDTPEEAASRRRLEEEQIARYMNSFSKHVQYLRMDPSHAAERLKQENAANARQKPKLKDFRSIASVGEDGTIQLDEQIVDIHQPEISKAEQRRRAVSIDWFGYYAAVCHLIGSLAI